MPEQYTPTTEQAKRAYVTGMRQAFIASAGEHGEEWDRFIAAHDAQVLRDAAAKIAAGVERQTRRTVELTLLAEADRMAGGTSA